MSDQDESSGPESGETVPLRKCGRCRQRFEADPHHVEGTIGDWWLCGPCRAVLLGDDGPAHHRTAGS